MIYLRPAGDQPFESVSYRQWLIGQALAGVAVSAYHRETATVASFAVRLADETLKILDAEARAFALAKQARADEERAREERANAWPKLAVHDDQEPPF